MVGKKSSRDIRKMDWFLAERITAQQMLSLHILLETAGMRWMNKDPNYTIDLISRTDIGQRWLCYRYDYTGKGEFDIDYHNTIYHLWGTKEICERQNNPLSYKELVKKLKNVIKQEV